MKKQNKAILKIILMYFLASVIASFAKVEGLKILEFDFVLTIVGVLLGFGLSIYTFSVQLLQPIIDNIERKIKGKEKQDKIINLIKSGIIKLKEDLWILFFSILIIIFVGVASFSIKYDFVLFHRPILYFPQTVYLTIYLISLSSVADLMKSLFRIGEITIELLDMDYQK